MFDSSLRHQYSKGKRAINSVARFFFLGSCSHCVATSTGFLHFGQRQQGAPVQRLDALSFEDICLRSSSPCCGAVLLCQCLVLVVGVLLRVASAGNLAGLRCGTSGRFFPQPLHKLNLRQRWE